MAFVAVDSPRPTQRIPRETRRRERQAEPDRHAPSSCFVFAPIGVAMFAKDTVPTFLKMFVARGQTEVDQRRKTAGTQAGNYKTIGQMAVKYGGPEVKRQAGAAAETVRRRAEETLAGIAAASAPPPAAPTSTSTSTVPPASPAPPTLRREPGRERHRRPGGQRCGAADSRLRPPQRDAGHRTTRRAGAAGAARDQGVRVGAPGPHDDPRQDRAARAVTR